MTGSVRRASTVFDVVLAMRQQVESAALPPSASGSTPEVTSVDPYVSEWREAICVVPNVEDTLATWGRMGPGGRDEIYRVDIVTRIVEPGNSDRDCIERLRDITAAIEAIWHDPATRTFAPPDVEGVQQLGGVVGTTFTVQPWSEGFAGESTIRFEIRARI